MLGLGRAALAGSGFDGKLGQTLTIPKRTAGSGSPSDRRREDWTPRRRDAAAAFARAAAGDAAGVSRSTAGGHRAAVAAQVAVEGMLLARYSYDPLKRAAAGTRSNRSHRRLARAAPTRGGRRVKRGRTLARATMLARDLANTPPAHLTAIRMAEVAAEIAGRGGLDVEIFDRDALVSLGCGG